MRLVARPLLLTSLAVNVVLSAIFVTHPALFPTMLSKLRGDSRNATAHESDAVPADGSVARDLGVTRARVTAETVADFWRTLNSPHLPAFVRNLRAAGFSPEMMEEMVFVRIEALLMARLDVEAALAADAPFWKPEPFVLGSGDASAFYLERSRLLRVTLGVDSPSQAHSEDRSSFLKLAASKSEAVAKIDHDYSEMRDAIRTASRGIELPEDRERMALLERGQRADIMAILTPEELQAYDMRRWILWRPVTRALSLMDGTEEEYRTIFRVHQPFADVLEQWVNTPAHAERRREAQRQVDEQLRMALGDVRYAEYVRSSNHEFRDLFNIAALQDLPADAAINVFNRRGVFAEESRRVHEASDLNAEQKRGALQALGKKIRVEIVSSLGPTAGDEYIRMAGWITQIENGAVLTVEPDGSMKAVGQLPQVRITRGTSR